MPHIRQILVYMLHNGQCMLTITAGSTVNDIAMIELCSQDTNECVQFAFDCPRGRRCRGIYLFRCDEHWILPQPPQPTSPRVRGTTMFQANVCTDVRVVDGASTTPFCGGRGPCAWVEQPYEYGTSEPRIVTYTYRVEHAGMVVWQKTVRQKRGTVVAIGDVEGYASMYAHVDNIDKETMIVQPTIGDWLTCQLYQNIIIRMYSPDGNIVADIPYNLASLYACTPNI